MNDFASIRNATRKVPKPVEQVFINGRSLTHATSGPAFNDGIKAATPIRHTDNKNDGKDIGRPRVITY